MTEFLEHPDGRVFLSQQEAASVLKRRKPRHNICNRKVNFASLHDDMKNCKD